MGRNIRLTVVSMAIIAFIGCGSDSKGPHHGVSEGNKLDSLNQQQIDAICTDIHRRMTDASDPFVNLQSSTQAADFVCELQALVVTLGTGGNSKDCQSRKQQCVEAFPETPQRSENNSNNNSIEAFEPNCGTPSTYAGCEATVADVDICTSSFINVINEFTDNIQSAIGSISCSNVGKENKMVDAFYSAFDARPNMLDISQCRAIQQKCPNIIYRINTTTLPGPWSTMFPSQN
jgi:hypothetical protein